MSSLRFSPFFCPDLDEDQKKKGFHPDSARFFAQIFCTNSKVGGHDSILRTVVRLLCITGTPKGGGRGTILPPKYAPASGVRRIFEMGGVSKVTSKLWPQSTLWQINKLSAVSQNGIKVTQCVMQIKLFEPKTIKH